MAAPIPEPLASAKLAPLDNQSQSGSTARIGDAAFPGRSPEGQSRRVMESSIARETKVHGKLPIGFGLGANINSPMPRTAAFPGVVAPGAARKKPGGHKEKQGATDSFESAR